MAEADERSPGKITIRRNGAIKVEGGIPLVRKTQIVSEYGEPLTWETGERIETKATYFLCRCGKSVIRPICDGAHTAAGFDGTETADTRPTAERQVVYEGGTRIVVRRDYPICCESGFCGTRDTEIKQMVPETADTNVRSQVMAMIERCPSGSYTYKIEEGQPDIEPDLPRQIAVTTEITSSGPIEGPLWVSGGIPIERADKQPFETRNRVTLCSCGLSKNKPLCDGAHRQGR